MRIINFILALLVTIPVGILGHHTIAAPAWQQIQPPPVCSLAGQCYQWPAADGNLYASSYLTAAGGTSPCVWVSGRTNCIYKVSQAAVANTGTINFTATTTSTSTSLTSVSGMTLGNGTYFVTGTGIPNGDTMTVSSGVSTLVVAATASGSVTLTASNLVTWTFMQQIVGSASSTELVSTIAYVGGTLYMSMYNASSTCDVYTWTGSAFSLVSGFATGSCSGANPVTSIVATSAGKACLGAGVTLWCTTTAGGTTVTEVSSSATTGWPAEGAGQIYSLIRVTIAGVDYLALSGESNLCVGNLAWSAGVCYGASVTANNKLAIAFDPASSTFIWEGSSTTNYPPNTLNILGGFSSSLPLATATVTQPTCATPTVMPACVYSSNSVGLNSMGYLKNNEILYSVRWGGGSTVYWLISTNDGASWTDITTLGSVPTACNSTGLQPTQWQSWFNPNYGYTRCSGGVIGEFGPFA